MRRLDDSEAWNLLLFPIRLIRDLVRHNGDYEAYMEAHKTETGEHP